MQLSSKNSYKFREELYNLIIGQLFYDGYQVIAANLASMMSFPVNCAPSDKLANLYLSTKAESFDADLSNEFLDFEEEPKSITAPEPALYETKYITAHKGPCRVAIFSPDGEFAATGSSDASIKVINVDKVMKRTSFHDSNPLSADHPVIRTLFDHLGEVTSLQFHPTASVIISGSKDCTVKVFDYSKPALKKALKSIQESEPINTIALHPTGEYLLVGTDQPTLRLYNLATSQCYVSPQPLDQHTKSLTCINYDLDGRIYASCSNDGSIRIWDGISNRCVNSFPNAHEGSPIISLKFSKNSKYLITAARDTSIKLWELNASRCLIAYGGVTCPNGKPDIGCPAVFNHTEEYVLYPDENSNLLYSWETRTALQQPNLQLGHSNFIRYIEHSSHQPLLITCSEDFRARFWSRSLDY